MVTLKRVLDEWWEVERAGRKIGVVAHTPAGWIGMNADGDLLSEWVPSRWEAVVAVAR